MPHRPLLLLLLVMTAACKKVEPAPTDLDGLVHYLWQNFDEAEDAELAQAAVNLHDVVGGDTMAEVSDGTISALDAAEVAQVGRDDADPAQAQGIYMTRPGICSLDTLVDVLVVAEQDVLYPGNYDSYTRSYDEDVDAFVAGDSPSLEWDLTYELTLLGATYEATSRGALRRVGGLGDDELPLGPVVFARTYMTQPAAFEEGSKKSMDQDYQIEAFWERAPGELVHVYGMWRQGDYGAGYTTESEGVQRLLLNGMSSWDDDTERLCAEGW